jgi:nucleoside phosphorylase
MVNIGTAGALRSGLSGLYLPGAVINHDMSSELLRSVGITITDQLALTGGDDRVVLATGDTFVVDPVLRAALGERASLVDMEGFAIAWAARHHDVMLRLVKHVSDNADSTALDWPLAVDASARALGDWLLGWLGESRS